MVKAAWPPVCAGIFVLAGCSKSPLAPKPAVVYVGANRLEQSHPQWRDVAALDKQISWLVDFAPRGGAVNRTSDVGRIGLDLPRAAVSLGPLEATIDQRLRAVRASELMEVNRRMEDRRTVELRQVDEQVAAYRLTSEQSADEARKKLTDQYGLRLTNLRLSREALKSQLPTRTEAVLRPEQSFRRQAIEKRVADVTTEITRLMEEWDAADRNIAAQLAASVETQRTTWIAAADGRLVSARRLLVEALDREILERREYLMTTLRSVGGAQSVPPDGSPRSLPAVDVAFTRPPTLKVQEILLSLTERRRKLASFVLQSTEALVKSAAAKRNEVVVFTPTGSAPDRTEDYRPSVSRSSAPVMPGTRA